MHAERGEWLNEPDYREQVRWFHRWAALALAGVAAMVGAYLISLDALLIVVWLTGGHALILPPALAVSGHKRLRRHYLSRTGQLTIENPLWLRPHHIPRISEIRLEEWIPDPPEGIDLRPGEDADEDGRLRVDGADYQAEAGVVAYLPSGERIFLTTTPWGGRHEVAKRYAAIAKAHLSLPVR